MQFDEKNWWERIPAYWKTALLWGGIFFAVALFFGLWIFEDIPAAATEQGDGIFSSVEKNALDSRPILVLDAGHGGFDPGAVSADGSVLEAEVTQEMVDRVAALFEPHQLELQVVQAHTPGTYATPKGRANTASGLAADLFVSLHLNADTSVHTRGFQVFPAPPGRIHHAESLRFAQLLVERVRPTGAKILGENGVYYCYYVKTAQGYYEKLLMDSAVANPEDPWDDESFGVVEYAGCPAVLVELWHLSNSADMANFNTESGKDTLARSVYQAICDYFGIQPIKA